MLFYTFTLALCSISLVRFSAEARMMSVSAGENIVYGVEVIVT